MDKKVERYYYEVSGGELTIWKHIVLLPEEETETLIKTVLAINDIDWDYFNRSFPEAPASKKVSGKAYFVLSINAIRGKRFNQEKYYMKETAVETSSLNVDIYTNSEDDAKVFYDKLKGLQ